MSPIMFVRLFYGTCALISAGLLGWQASYFVAGTASLGQLAVCVAALAVVLCSWAVPEAGR